MFFLTVVVFGVLNIVVALSELNTDRIIGGKDISIDSESYVVSIQNRGNHFCGGALISSKIVVSASHCFKKYDPNHTQDLTIRCGSRFKSQGGTVKQVETFLRHPEFDPKTLGNDIALLKLSSAVVPSSVVKFIKLTSKTPADGTACTISGWGKTNSDDKGISETLKSAELKIVSNERCRSDEFDYMIFILPKVICATADGIDSCQGDSGGPLKSIEDNTLVGVVSYGFGCASPKYPGVYTDVSLYLDWISDGMRFL